MKRVQVMVFGGTSDGRRLGQELARRGVTVQMHVATEHGEAMVEPCPGLEVSAGRLDAGEMAGIIRQEGCPVVVDATHPYAARVSENIRRACGETGAEYLRPVRDSGRPEDVTAAAGPEEAAAILAREGGRALLTVGSRDLEAFTAVPGYEERLFARVLPVAESLEKCVRLGFTGRNLICMQGPFSHGINVAMLREFQAHWLVTKDSGDAGGLPEKLTAAREAGARVLLITRPGREEGPGFDQVLGQLLHRFGVAEPVREQNPEARPRFPLFVSLQGKEVLLVGGGGVALRRAKTLERCGARITVLAPQLREELRAMPPVRTVERPYRTGDLAQRLPVLAVAATDSREVNRLVRQEAATLHIPCSVADDPEAGDFWFPALVTRDNLSIGLVSTDGDHGAVRHAAQRLRKGEPL